VFIVILLLSEGQAGEACEPSEKISGLSDIAESWTVFHTVTRCRNIVHCNRNDSGCRCLSWSFLTMVFKLYCFCRVQ
jgi:hypothetical protein